ncbi:MAG: hypothetical protein E7Z62_04365 [Thermoplasmata archaeon]|nr:hypothetical protein [Thermoplasmata archaeon]
MENATHEMKMPTNYVDMSESEMEFDGGWSWGKFFATVAIVGVAIACCGVAGVLVGAMAGSMALIAGSGAVLGIGSIVAAVGGVGTLAVDLSSPSPSQ